MNSGFETGVSNVKRGSRLAAFALVLLTAAAAWGQSGGWKVFLRRAGPARIGLSVAETRRVLGDPGAYLAFIAKEPDNAECAYLQSAAIPRSVGLMFQEGRLVRIDVRDAQVRTASGVGVGDTAEEVKRAYPGRISVELHPYLRDTGSYLVFMPLDESDRAFSMIFETENGNVTSFRAGRRDAVELIEGCS